MHNQVITRYNQLCGKVGVRHVSAKGGHN